MDKYEQRREELKAALRQYADRFDMAQWFSDHGLDDRYLRREPISKEEFEACGSACCIAGMAIMLHKVDTNGLDEFYGLKKWSYDYLPYQDEWPESISSKYMEAKDNEDHAGMVEAACEAIDYYTDKDKVAE